MDKFTKTTDVDTSDADLLEEKAQKKSKIGRVIALVISLLLAVAIWVYVAETDATIVEKDYNVSVMVVGTVPDYDITADDVTVTVEGTTSQLVDIDKSDIIVKVDISSLTGWSEGKRCVNAEVNVLNDGGVTVKNSEAIRVTLNVVKSK